jgi:hypothetical protein
MRSGDVNFKKDAEKEVQKLQVDCKMYAGAIKDLTQHGGDKKTIEELRSKLQSAEQALNLIRTAHTERKGRFFVK